MGHEIQITDFVSGLINKDSILTDLVHKVKSNESLSFYQNKAKRPVDSANFALQSKLEES